MTRDSNTVTFTAVFILRPAQMEYPDGVLHKVPPGGAQNSVTFDVTKLQGAGAPSAIQMDNKQMVTLNEVITVWSQELGAASNQLIESFEKPARLHAKPKPSKDYPDPGSDC